jgi:hypothetical protein
MVEFFCPVPAPSPSRSQAAPGMKAKNAFFPGASCACRGCEKIDPFFLDQGAFTFLIALSIPAPPEKY